METQKALTEVAEWASRNPNGLQPIATFADDYASPGRLHYNVPPLQALAKRSIFSASITPFSVKWCGYSGSKPFFAQQPMPGSAFIQLTGGYVPHRSSIDCAFIKQTDLPPRMGESVPCENVNVTAIISQDGVMNTTLSETHPSQIACPDSHRTGGVYFAFEADVGFHAFNISAGLKSIRKIRIGPYHTRSLKSMDVRRAEQLDMDACQLVNALPSRSTTTDGQYPLRLTLCALCIITTAKGWVSSPTGQRSANPFRYQVCRGVRSFATSLEATYLLQEPLLRQRRTHELGMAEMHRGHSQPRLVILHPAISYSREVCNDPSHCFNSMPLHLRMNPLGDTLDSASAAIKWVSKCKLVERPLRRPMAARRQRLSATLSQTCIRIRGCLTGHLVHSSQEMVLSCRYRSRMLSVVTVVGCTILIWHHIFKSLDQEDGGPPAPQRPLDVSEYQEGVAVAFFAAIDSPEHENCQLFRHRFPFKPDRDGDVDIAFTITVKDDIRPVARILRMIYRVNNYYCIHLDKSVDLAFEAAVHGLISCFGPNVELVPKKLRVALDKGDESAFKIQLVCAGQALRSNENWTYLINLEDDIFPLRTNLEIVAILKALNGSNMVESFPIDRFRRRTRNRILPLNATWYKGTVYGIYKREFLQEAVFGKAVAPIRDLLLQRRAFLTPEEFYFPILVYNPQLRLPGACRVAPSPPSEVNLGFLGKFIIWGDYGIRCTTKYVDFVCVLGSEHLPMLKMASHLFAAKFLPDYEPKAYANLEMWYFDRIKAELQAGTLINSTFDASIYASRSCSRYHI
ncbi:hypothetical protein TcWFU_000433 [Taenia crassiceps]|uniref:Uncharacterized protein n=1 Tax=Taenia crassiceps TaxID=6207 RepID=A0ABR4Q1U1_9CEST